ncbi:SDR family NAD(P)-dependent oxidoreductase [Sphingobium sp. DEHP117]|uniref:SDR family NAD(P)-dependent oxidoreductase n=1 Tax=Sphingobium sp. DEHP117 TaxID=2993436 RepID=UPI0027D4EA92|nr:SDR family oxidoreductase [Sphingobium sp. DEHP117]MDQ4420985.1 SDR family NAD(P)-dependent oxidoreductase [Sphingobium sp. DEHP117]
MNVAENQLNEAGSLAGKVALVTGGGTGIGRAAALSFAKKGATVVAAGRRQAALNAVVGEIESAGGKAAAITADISKENEVTALIKAVVERFGRLDAAFNNAATTGNGPIETLTTEVFDSVFATNVRGVWMLIQQEIIAMRTLGNGGAIVNTSSIAATGGNVGLSIYGASKGALDAMIRHIALEVGSDGIRINNVSPGLTRTPMTADFPEEAFAVVGGHAALKRVAEADDVGDVAVWLCTNEARFVTGQSILADGGYNIAGMR